MLTPAFARRAADGEYWLVDDGHNRLPAVLIGDANGDLPAAVVIPLDGDFPTRADAALRLWRLIVGRPRVRPPDRLTHTSGVIALVLRCVRLTGALLASPIASLRRDCSATHAPRPVPAGRRMTCATAPFALCALAWS